MIVFSQSQVKLNVKSTIHLVFVLSFSAKGANTKLLVSWARLPPKSLTQNTIKSCFLSLHPTDIYLFVFVMDQRPKGLLEIICHYSETAPSLLCPSVSMIAMLLLTQYLFLNPSFDPTSIGNDALIGPTPISLGSTSPSQLICLWSNRPLLYLDQLPLWLIKYVQENWMLDLTIGAFFSLAIEFLSILSYFPFNLHLSKTNQSKTNQLSNFEVYYHAQVAHLMEQVVLPTDSDMVSHSEGFSFLPVDTRSASMYPS